MWAMGKAMGNTSSEPSGICSTVALEVAATEASVWAMALGVAVEPEVV